MAIEEILSAKFETTVVTSISWGRLVKPWSIVGLKSILIYEPHLAGWATVSVWCMNDWFQVAIEEILGCELEFTV
jgi:hypothetical protein